MHFNALSGLVLALACITSAAPTVEPARLQKRDTCQFLGQYSVEVVVGSGGPGQAPVSYTHSYLSIQYEGGVNISPALGGSNANSITSKKQTFPPDQTRLPNDIVWYADFNLGYSSCTVEYEGQTYTGGSTNPGSQPAGTSAWACTVNFPCEGGISALPGSK